MCLVNQTMFKNRQSDTIVTKVAPNIIQDLVTNQIQIKNIEWGLNIINKNIWQFNGSICPPMTVANIHLRWWPTATYNHGLWLTMMVAYSHL